MLNVPKNSTVTIYNSVCCGMAGSFGYEEEHYEISMQMGEDTLFQNKGLLLQQLLLPQQVQVAAIKF
jgi:Fe-S oxidoreductase